MPDLAELLALTMLAALAGAWVARPLLRFEPPSSDADRDELELRHRAALDALRELEADHRAGLLDPTAYVRQRHEAEAHAATSLRELEAAHPAIAPSGRAHGAPRALVLAGAALGAVLLVGVVLPPPFSLANPTMVDERLAAEQRAEATRQARIAAAQERLAADPTDTAALSDLADAYLAGGSDRELAAAAAALILLVNLEPDDEDAFARLITAYLSAGDHGNAAAALESFREIDPDPVDLAFFEGLIARGGGQTDAALAAFARFLELAPDDPRATMVRAMRDELAGD